MSDTNSIVMIGRLIRDPELSYSQNNKAICKFGIANNGIKNDDVSYFDIAVFGVGAENCNKFLKKGSQVSISGSLKQNRYTNKDGEKRSKIEIIAFSVQFLGGKSDSAAKPNQAPTNHQSYPNHGENPSSHKRPQNQDGAGIQFDDSSELAAEMTNGDVPF